MLHSSLEVILDFYPRSSPLTPDLRDKALVLYKQIVTYFEPIQGDLERLQKRKHKKYKAITLLQVTYNVVIRKDVFLDLLFLALYLATATDEQKLVSGPELYEKLPEIVTQFEDFPSWLEKRKNELERGLVDLAELLVHSFLLPIKASGNKTPHAVSPLPGMGDDEPMVATSRRLYDLRKLCLIRDGYRCVIGGQFDQVTYIERFALMGVNTRDDDGLPCDRAGFAGLEVAHILPHSLTSGLDSALAGSANQVLSESKKLMVSVLDMFHPGIMDRIGGINIDRPFNAISLSHDFHAMFGSFDLFFKEEAGIPHRYTVDWWNDFPPGFRRGLPKIVDLRLTPGRTCDPPSPDFFAIHRAIGQILHLSGAAQVIEEILRDLEVHLLRADGSTPVGDYVNLRLGGWVAAACR